MSNHCAPQHDCLRVSAGPSDGSWCDAATQARPARAATATGHRPAVPWCSSGSVPCRPRSQGETQESSEQTHFEHHALVVAAALHARDAVAVKRDGILLDGVQDPGCQHPVARASWQPPSLDRPWRPPGGMEPQRWLGLAPAFAKQGSRPLQHATTGLDGRTGSSFSPGGAGSALLQEQQSQIGPSPAAPHRAAACCRGRGQIGVCAGLQQCFHPLQVGTAIDEINRTDALQGPPRWGLVPRPGLSSPSRHSRCRIRQGCRLGIAEVARGIQAGGAGRRQ